MRGAGRPARFCPRGVRGAGAVAGAVAVGECGDDAQAPSVAGLGRAEGGAGVGDLDACPARGGANGDGEGAAVAGCGVNDGVGSQLSDGVGEIVGAGAVGERVADEPAGGGGLRRKRRAGQRAWVAGMLTAPCLVRPFPVTR